MIRSKRGEGHGRVTCPTWRSVKGSARSFQSAFTVLFSLQSYPVFVAIMVGVFVLLLIGDVCATSGSERARPDDTANSLYGGDKLQSSLPQTEIVLEAEPPAKRRRQSADDNLATVQPGPVPPAVGVYQAMFVSVLFSHLFFSFRICTARVLPIS
jgi:hypothetical protein